MLLIINYLMLWYQIRIKVLTRLPANILINCLIYNY
jgi:hypothetical protein